MHALLGITRFAGDNTIRNRFRRFRMGDVHRLLVPLAESLMARLPVRQDSYTPGLLSFVGESCGWQEGSRKGHNPRKRYVSK